MMHYIYISLELNISLSYLCECVNDMLLTISIGSFKEGDRTVP